MGATTQVPKEPILLDDEEAERQTREPFRHEWDKRYGQVGRDWADYLFSQRQQLLAHLALWRHLGNIGSLVDEAVSYSRRQQWVPQEIDVEWLHWQMEVLLRRTGLLSSSSGEDSFIHSTFREYLAASSLASLYDPDEAETGAIVSRMAKGDEREVALFLLGIWSSKGQDVTKIIQYVTNSDGNDGLLFSGTALVEGAKVVAVVAEEIINRLITYSENLHFHDLKNNLNPLNVLSRLQDQEKVAIGFASLARNPRVREHVRLRAAQLLLQPGHIDNAISSLMSISQDPLVHYLVRNLAVKELGQLGRSNELLSLVLNHSLDAIVRVRALNELKKHDLTGDSRYAGRSLEINLTHGQNTL